MVSSRRRVGVWYRARVTVRGEGLLGHHTAVLSLSERVGIVMIRVRVAMIRSSL